MTVDQASDDEESPKQRAAGEPETLSFEKDLDALHGGGTRCSSAMSPYGAVLVTRLLKKRDTTDKKLPT